MKTLILIPILAVSSLAAVNPHPRLLVTPTQVTEMKALRTANDPLWTNLKARADSFLNLPPYKLTIISASNSNPVVFTTAESIGWSVTTDLFIGGMTGSNWAKCNTLGLMSIANGYLTSIVVTNNVGTVNVVGSALVGSGGIVITGSATAALNKDYSPYTGSGSTYTITTSGVPDGTYTDAGLRLWRYGGGWSATRVGTNSFSIPVDSTTWGMMTGTPLTFLRNNAADGFINYNYESLGQDEQVYSLALAYLVSGQTNYATTAIAVMDYFVALTNLGVLAPYTLDAGYPVRGLGPQLALIYDWCYPVLTSTEKTNFTAATNIVWDNYVAAMNDTSTLVPDISFFFASGCGGAPFVNNNCPTSIDAWQVSGQQPMAQSNYWFGYIWGFAALGYAGDGDNSRASEIWAGINNQFDNQMGLASASPSGPQQGADPSESWCYGGDTISRMEAYLYTRLTANNDNQFNTTWAQNYANKLIYGFRPDGYSVPITGECTGTYARVQTPYLMLVGGYAMAGTNAGKYLQWQYNHAGSYPGPGGAWVALPYQKLLYQRAANTGTDYSSVLPTYYMSPGDQTLTWRSDWTANATYMYARMEARNFSGHNSYLGGDMAIVRGSDYLIHTASEWRGGGPGTNITYAGTYGTPTLAGDEDSTWSNTLFFNDGGTYRGNWGSQYARQTYVAPLYSGSSNYVYSFADLTGAYDIDNYGRGLQGTANRSLRYYFRSVLALGDGAFVVWDQIKALKNMNDGVNYTAAIRWHFNSSYSVPSVSSGVVSNVAGNSKIFVKPVYPATASIAIQPDKDGSGNTAMYRADVSNAVPGTSMDTLTVLYATSSAGSLPASSTITTDANHIGVLVADTIPKVVVLGSGVGSSSSYPSYAPTQYNIVTYTANYSGTAKHVVANMQPNTVWVAKRGVSQIAAGLSDSSGTVFFTDSVGGSFTVSQVIVPPSGPGMPGSVSASGTAIVH